MVQKKRGEAKVPRKRKPKAKVGFRTVGGQPKGGGGGRAQKNNKHQRVQNFYETNDDKQDSGKKNTPMEKKRKKTTRGGERSPGHESPVLMKLKNSRRDPLSKS